MQYWLYIVIFIMLNYFILSSEVINVPDDFSTIHYAIINSVDGDSVIVAQGIYFENINLLGKNIFLSSKYYSTNDWNTVENTIIDGSNFNSVVSYINNENEASIINGFTIQNGDSNEGGGIYCWYTSPTIRNCIIRNCNSSRGGGLRMFFSSPIVDNVIFYNNTSSDHFGGAIYAGGSESVLSNLTIYSNYANKGGAIYINQSTIDIKYSIFYENNAHEGGACFIETSEPTFDHCTFYDNGATYGNAIEIYDSSNIHIENSIIWNNGNPSINGGTLDITYSDIENYCYGYCNIDENPLFVNPELHDFHIRPESPCIDSGDPAYTFDPDNTITDMGALYFNQIDSLLPPENLSINISDNVINLKWDRVANAISYFVYSSTDPTLPLSNWTLETEVLTKCWSESTSSTMKYYFITANNGQ